MKKLFFLSLLVFAACKKTDDNTQLPGPSSNGQNYLACKVNGKVHKYYGKSNYINVNGVAYLRFLDEVLVSANQSGYDAYMHVHIKGALDSIKAHKDYVFGDEISNSYASYDDSRPTLLTKYVTNSGSGWVRFSRIDTAVAAGTFAFTAYLNGQEGADSVVITDGRFDIPW